LWCVDVADVLAPAVRSSNGGGGGGGGGGRNGQRVGGD
jgi:hypothetical protein